MVARNICRFSTASLLLVLLCACGNDADRSSADTSGGKVPDVEPPFDLRGDTKGFLLVWFDQEGVHSAERRHDIPKAHRQYVRVKPLKPVRDDKLPAGSVYVADLRKARNDGRYSVKVMTVDHFESLVDGSKPKAKAVVLYGADWCGACNATARFFRSEGIDFIEKNIEKDPGAQAEMQSKLRAAGKAGGGIPVIDFRGTIVQGFDRNTLRRLAKDS